MPHVPLTRWVKVKSIQTICAFNDFNAHLPANQNLVFRQTMVSMYFYLIFIFVTKMDFQHPIPSYNCRRREKNKRCLKMLICCLFSNRAEPTNTLYVRKTWGIQSTWASRRSSVLEKTKWLSRVCVSVKSSPALWRSFSKWVSASYHTYTRKACWPLELRTSSWILDRLWRRPG